MKQNKFFISLLICFGLMFVVFSCNREQEIDCCLPPPLPCAGMIVCAETFENTPEYLAGISNLRIEGDYLKFTLHASGCSGSSWVVKLIAGTIRHSVPPHKTLRIHFENNEDCNAWLGREFSFNIECLQVPGRAVVLGIAGQHILYEY